MPRKGPKLGFIVEINLRFIRGCLALLYGAGLMYLDSIGMWGAQTLAYIAFIAGGIYLIVTLYKIVQFWMRDGEIAAYEDQGRKPKADRPTDESILGDAGMIE